MRRLLAAVAVFALRAPDAQAHTPIPGMGDVISGAAHPFATPAHVLVLLALGLLIGQRPDAYLAVLPAAFPTVAVGLGLTLLQRGAAVPVPFFVLLALASGGLVALDRSLPRVVCAALVAAATLGIGLDSGLEPGGAASVAKTLVGAWLGVCLGLVSLAYYVSLAAESGRKWLAIAIRVSGSWIVAISLLMLAFSLRRA